MPIGFCSGILEGGSLNEFILYVGESALVDYLYENKLIPKNVGLPRPTDMVPTLAEGLERLKKEIKGYEDELRLIETIPIEQLIKETIAKHYEWYNKNQLSKSDQERYKAVLEKLEKWNPNNPIAKFTKKHAKDVIMESMVSDKFSNYIDPWWFSRDYYINIPEPYTEQHALIKIEGEKRGIKRLIKDGKKKYKYWKIYLELQDKFYKELEESLIDL